MSDGEARPVLTPQPVLVAELRAMSDGEVRPVLTARREPKVDVDQPDPARPVLVAEWRLRVELASGVVVVFGADSESEARAMLGRLVFGEWKLGAWSVERRLVSAWATWRAVEPGRPRRSKKAKMLGSIGSNGQAGPVGQGERQVTDLAPDPGADDGQGGD
jgi:hypothetical protein